MVVGLEPQALNFGEVKVGAQVTRTVELVGQEAAGVQLTVDELSDDALSAAVRLEDGRTFIDVTLDPKRPRSMKGRLTATTSHDKVPKLNVRVHGRVVGNLKVVPHSVSIQGLDGQPKPGVVVITSDKPGFEVTSAEDPKGKVDVVVSEQEGKWRIEVTPKESGEGTQSFRTHLAVQTNDDLEPTLEIPVVARAGANRRRPDRGPIPGTRVPARRGADSDTDSKK